MVGKALTSTLTLQMIFNMSLIYIHALNSHMLSRISSRWTSPIEVSLDVIPIILTSLLFGVSMPSQCIHRLYSLCTIKYVSPSSLNSELTIVFIMESSE